MPSWTDEFSHTPVFTMHLTISNGRIRRAMKLTALGLVGLTMAAKCGDGKAGDATVTRLSDGQVRTGDSAFEFSGLSHTIDRDDYVKWLAAQQALDGIPDLTVPTRVSLRNFTESDIKLAADALEANPRAKLAIRSADLSVEDYVRTSVAFEQAMASLAVVSPTRFRDLPRENIDLVNREGAAFRRTWDARRFRVVDDRRDGSADSDGDSDGESDARARDNRDSDNRDSEARKRDGRDSDGDSDKKNKKGDKKGKKNGRGDR